LRIDTSSLQAQGGQRRHTFFNILRDIPVAGGGIELTNLTTENFLLILMAILLYHFVAFGVRVYEEFKFWQQTFADQDAGTDSGGFATVTLTKKLEQVANILEAIIRDSGSIAYKEQTVITEKDVIQLIEAAKAANIYAKRLKNFPYITGFRFIGWDVGFAMVLSILAFGIFWIL
jgi:hypothetical protein